MTMRNRKGYSLVELMAVIAIIGVLAVLAMPSLAGLMRGSQLTTAGQTISGQFALARQDAMAQNRSVKLSIYQSSDGRCGLGSSLVQDDGSTVPLRRVSWLPVNVVLSSGLTTLSSSPYSTSGTTTLPATGSVSYFSLVFRPDGSLGTSSFTSTAPYLTLVNRGAQGNPPVNFYTLLINPATGRAEYFRP